MQVRSWLSIILAAMVVVPAWAQRDSVAAGGRDDGAAENFVRAYFAAWDAGDVNKLDGLLLPDAKFTHPGGRITDKQETLSIIRNVKNWPPRVRQLSRFEVHSFGNAIVVGLTNHVRFTPADRAPYEHTYNETWILERTESGLKALRTYYSVVPPQP